METLAALIYLDGSISFLYVCFGIATGATTTRIFADKFFCKTFAIPTTKKLANVSISALWDTAKWSETVTMKAIRFGGNSKNPETVCGEF